LNIYNVCILVKLLQCVYGLTSSAFNHRVKQFRIQTTPPSSTKVKNVWSCTFTPQYVFVVWCLGKHRDNFTFTFYYRPYTFIGELKVIAIFSFIMKTQKRGS